MPAPERRESVFGGGWASIDPRAGVLAQMVNDHANAGIFWDEERDRAKALEILAALDAMAPEKKGYPYEVPPMLRGPLNGPTATTEAIRLERCSCEEASLYREALEAIAAHGDAYSSGAAARALEGVEP